MNWEVKVCKKGIGFVFVYKMLITYNNPFFDI